MVAENGMCSNCCRGMVVAVGMLVVEVVAGCSRMAGVWWSQQCEDTDGVW